MNYIYIWQFDVAEGKEREFEEAYGPKGPWVELFQTDDSYRGTVLLKDLQTPGRYSTIDRWENRESYRSFKERNLEAFNALDTTCESLTVNEILIGEYESTD